MQQIIRDEQHFQVLGTNFTVGASQSGYDLMFSADGVSFTKLFSVGAGVNRQVTQVAAGSYYYLSGNTDEVTINWMKDCGGSGSGGGSYVLPIASENTLGGVKIGSGITIDENGAISAQGGSGSDAFHIELSAIEPENWTEDDIAALQSMADYLSGKTIEQVEGAYIYTLPDIYALTALDDGSAIFKSSYQGLEQTLTLEFENVNDSTLNGTTYGNYRIVSSLSDIEEPYDGLMAYVTKESQTGYTFTKEVSDWESGIQMAYVDGDEVYYDGYYQNFGVWRNGKRFRRDGSHIYADRLGGGEVTLIDADSYAENTFPSIGSKFIYQGEQWMPMERTIEVDYDENPELAKALFIEIYSGTSDFSPEWLTVRHRVDDKFAREFKPYESHYYGMDMQASDSRGSADGDWGRLHIDSWRMAYDWENDSISFAALVGTIITATQAEVPTIFKCRFGNDDRGGLTYDADNDVFYYDSNTIPTGDTTTVYDDLIDNNITNWLISGEQFVMNNNALTVTWGNGGQVNEVYTHPIVERHVMVSPISIDGRDFYKEITYNYGKYILTAVYGADDGNNGAYLRMTTV